VLRTLLSGKEKIVLSKLEIRGAFNLPRKGKIDIIEKGNTQRSMSPLSNGFICQAKKNPK
jgi:hypothetical protein